MKTYLRLTAIILPFLGITIAETASQANTATKSSTESQPAYQPQEAITGYIPHATYPYADVFGPVPGHAEYLVPSANGQFSINSLDYTPIKRNSDGLLQQSLKILSKVGLFLAGGVALLVVGSIFTTVICSLTPICIIKFPGLEGLNKEAVRSFVTSEGVANAAAFVENAVDKYQRLQRNINSYM